MRISFGVLLGQPSVSMNVPDILLRVLMSSAAYMRSEGVQRLSCLLESRIIPQEFSVHKSNVQPFADNKPWSTFILKTLFHW